MRAALLPSKRRQRPAVILFKGLYSGTSDGSFCMILWEEYPRFRFARRDHGTVSYAVHGQLLLVFFFVKQDQNLVLRKSRLINGVAPDTVRNTFFKHFLNLFMNDASFSRRDSVGSLVDWSMITSKNPVFHIRLRGCRLVGLREKPRKFPE
ncbi:hypothetical protein TNCV_719081 [Trichonephila clavipes]|nr:hypothetical protein TNCV_719081 [Trichonephila clavipes]